MIFGSDFFFNNRRKLAQHTKSKLLVIGGGGIISSSSWETFPFRQDGNFWYLTGIDQPDFVLVMAGWDEFLISPSRDPIREIFDGKLDLAQLSKDSGVKQILDEKAGWQKLKKLLAKNKQVGTLLPAPTYAKAEGIYANPVRAHLGKKLKRAGAKKLEDLRPVLVNLRMIKQPVEVKALQSAIDLTIGSFKETFSHRGDFKHEYQLEAALIGNFRARGAVGHAYPPIVAGGKNACTLHYGANNQPLRSKDLVLVDAGARYNNYPADLTRTIALGSPTVRQMAVFDAVNRVRRFAISQLKPGVLLKNYSREVVDNMGQELLKLKLINRPEVRQIRQYFPHGVSHFLGLEVHDVGDYEVPLQAGMVLTVEPGIYIPEESLGIRQEDDVLITAQSNRVLSAKLPHKLVQ